MRRGRACGGARCCRLALAALLALGVTTASAVTRLRELVLSPQSQPIAAWSHGYAEHRLLVLNESATRRHEVRLVAPERAYGGYGDALMQIVKTVTLGPGASATVSLPAPALPFSGNSQVEVIVDGSQWGTVSLPSLSGGFHGRAYRDQKVAFLTSRAIDAQAFDDALWKELFEKGADAEGASPRRASRPGSHMAVRARTDKPYAVQRSEYELTGWSENWLAYSCFDAVLLAADDLAGLPDTLAESLRQYVCAGGVLVIAGQRDWPFAWTGRPGPTGKWGKTSFVGFGKVALVEPRDLTELDADGLRWLLDMGQETLSPWTHRTDIAGAVREFPVVDHLNLPVSGLYLVMLVFALVIGPLLLFVLARLDRRIYLLWIAPLLSAATCLTVALYALFSEGITPTVRLDGVTLLDQTDHRAVTLGLVGLYCPLTPSDGLRFDAHTELSLFVNGARHDAGQGKYMDWTRTQHLTQGWVAARVPMYFQVRKPEVRRERLEVVWDGERGRVLNGLGAPVEQLWVCRPDGRWYLLDGELAAGGDAGLRPDPAEASAVTQPAALREVYTSTKWPQSFGELVANRQRLLGPGMYLAVLKGAPFLEHGLTGRVEARTRSTVIGRFAATPGEVAP